MSNIIGIVNYGVAGNIHSIKKAIVAAGGSVLVIDKPEQFNDVDKIVLPGVGSFKDAMQELENGCLLDSLSSNKKPILGICLGMQVLSTIGFEYGKTRGLNFIEAEVKPILVDAKIPHMGFNTLEVLESSELLNGIENKEFYFMHSFEVVNYKNVISLTDYNGHKFVSSIQNNNIYGVQFHPEKSRKAGIKLFENFINIGIN